MRCCHAVVNIVQTVVHKPFLFQSLFNPMHVVDIGHEDFVDFLTFLHQKFVSYNLLYSPIVCNRQTRIA
ncbi:hypothetical protein BpHYR1_047566 [Brachionus plicatilis]|uniref:Uncharacterized protein n=1 Tax=Brachionus plicatilis TaxID=10195 RepID=A0A3M7SSB8_BRAPC|nr:hypothetical protein BpHYR1_047566 [Brachionus plicatilis]